MMRFALSAPDADRRAHLALALRVGLGSVFIIGGIAKLRRLLDPGLADGIVAQYTGSLGYINETFQSLLFSGALPGFVTPWSFLTLLSTFELVAGLMLVAGLLVRPLALFWSVFVWSFIFSLPVVTTPDVVPAETTYSSPALLVQVRDVALSGLFVALYILGPGSRSIDAGVYGLPRTVAAGWDAAGALLRYSLAVMFLVGGVLHGFHKIPTFDTPALVLVVIGLGLAAGVGTRAFAAGGVAVMVWYMAGKLGDASGVIGFLNAVKREFAFLAASAVLVAAGGGKTFTALSLWQGLLDAATQYRLRKPRPTAPRSA